MATSSFWGPFTQQPNILILMTDQQRTTQHYPDGWVEENLPNLCKLQQTGVTFANAMTNTSACSPSRAALFTSTYPTLNGVTNVGMTLNMNNEIRLPNQNPMQVTTLGKILQDPDLFTKGDTYDVKYKGKWHLDNSFTSGLNETQQEDNAQALANDDKTMNFTYNFPGWTSPDFGTAIDLSNKPDSASESDINTLGANGYDQNGDPVGNDARVTHGTSYPNSGQHAVQNAVQFLDNYASNDNKKPFFLVVSLLNPHDVWVYPENLEKAGWVKDPNGKYPWQYSPFTDITLPHTFDLTTEQINNKPSIQGEAPWRTDWEPDKATDYVRFYAFLETLTDKLFGKVCEALEKNSDVEKKNTLVIRIADHGEMAMAQGGMREKEHQAYNETLLVPMIFSNPALNTGTTCTGLAGLIDIIPTIADIVGIDLEKLKSKYPIQGRSLADTILNAGTSSATTYNQFLFATDDANAHIRCLIDDNCVIDDKIYKAKYAVYYNAVIGGNPNGTITGGMQFEMYKFSYTPGIPGSKTKSTPTAPRWDSEETNLLPLSGLSADSSSLTDSTMQLWREMHKKLTTRLNACGQTPGNWPTNVPLDPPRS